MTVMVQTTIKGIPCKVELDVEGSTPGSYHEPPIPLWWGFVEAFDINGDPAPELEDLLKNEEINKKFENDIDAYFDEEVG